MNASRLMRLAQLPIASNIPIARLSVYRPMRLARQVIEVRSPEYNNRRLCGSQSGMPGQASSSHHPERMEITLIRKVALLIVVLLSGCNPAFGDDGLGL